MVQLCMDNPQQPFTIFLHIKQQANLDVCKLVRISEEGFNLR